MSFQAYLDNVEEKTGLTPSELLARAAAKGFDERTKAGPILEWLAADYGLGRGHGMSIVHLVQKKSTGEVLWLDGKATKPA
jgi:hypothetical protein